ncbi:MAG: restriction endonuclease subunit S [Candidatus Micrarchaeia archaeon]
MVSLQHQIQLEMQKDIRWASVKISEVVERGQRLEASYYDVEGKKARELIANCSFPSLPINASQGFAKVYHRPRFRRIFLDEGIPIFTASQILETAPEADKHVSGKTDTDLQPLYLKKGQIVMTCSGSVGFVSYVSRILDGKLFSHDLLRIECHQKEDVGYIYAFLKTKMGYKIITTSNYGSVVTHIEPEHLSSVLVPNAPAKFKHEINEKIMRTFELRDEANELRQKADTLLYQRLGITPLNELKPKYFNGNNIRNFEQKASKLEMRFEAHYHVPIVDEIEAQLKKTGLEVVNVGNQRVSKAIILPGRFKRIYVDEAQGVPFLSGGNIMEFDPPDIKHLSKSLHSNVIEKEITIHQNMVLITRSGTVGNVVLAPQHLDGCTATEHIIRVVPSDAINPGYLYAFLASDYGRQLILRQKYGSVVDEMDNKQVASIPIPIPNRKIMDEIGNLVLEANDKLSEAYYLEKEAIGRVEELIVKNQK